MNTIISKRFVKLALEHLSCSRNPFYVLGAKVRKWREYQNQWTGPAFKPIIDYQNSAISPNEIVELQEYTNR